MAQHLSRCGTKREAENDLGEDQPLAKRLGRLHIDSTTVCPRVQPSLSPRGGFPSVATDCKMLLDDTKYTIYIHDLDREIAEIESQESCAPLLLDISEKLTPAIPQSIISPPLRSKGNELVLYREPTSLTVFKGSNFARKPIMEDRSRAEESTSGRGDSRTSQLHSSLSRDASGNTDKLDRLEDDAMDIDEDL